VSVPLELLPRTDHDGVTWDRRDFTVDNLSELTFSGCTFSGCDLSGLRLSGTRFENCRFVDCNLSNTVVDNTRFDGVAFEACKLVGLNFGASDPLTFGLSLTRCVLRYVNFSQLRWKKAVVTDCEALDSAVPTWARPISATPKATTSTCAPRTSRRPCSPCRKP